MRRCIRRWSRLALLAALPLGCSGPDPAAAQVQQIIDDLLVQRFGQATARYRAHEEQVLSDAGARVWRRVLDHEDATVREWAVDALSRIGDPEDIPRLAASLDDPFRRVQEAAAEGLIRVDPEAARQAFLERLGGGGAAAKILAAQGLADLGDHRATPLLVEQLQDADLEAGIRGVIAQSLGRLGDRRAAAALADVAMQVEADLQLRRNAGEALVLLEGPEVTAALKRLLGADDPYLQDLARRALQ